MRNLLSCDYRFYLPGYQFTYDARGELMEIGNIDGTLGKA